ncbi:hypothetical protein, partial [Campylobacter lari]|uniref:hypothetical protein n=1 Tax=Campylobacter lari TaxID=201 RepID=UPI0037263A1D
NASVEWTLTGDGKITSKDSKFNAKGEAYLNGQGKSPFNNSINVVFNALNQKINKTLVIKSYSEVPVDVSAFANYTCN